MASAAAEGSPLQAVVGLRRVDVAAAILPRIYRGTIRGMASSQSGPPYPEQHRQPVYLGTVSVPDNSMRIPRSWLSDDDAVDVFGDESTATEMVTYGLVLVRSAELMMATRAVEEVIRRAGLPPGTRFHASQCFSGDARSKTAWAHLGEFEIWDVAEAMLGAATQMGALFSVGIVDTSPFPAEVASWSGHGIKVGPEHFYALAFQAAMKSLAQGGVVRSTRPLTLWLDPQRSKVTFWAGLGTQQVGSSSTTRT